MQDGGKQKGTYTESNIQSLESLAHIRLRPGMYIGALGDGSSSEDGIYLLVKEVADNSIDEFVMNFGNRIEIDVDEKSAHIRDYGRGIPQGKLKDCVTKINTGGKFNNDVFQYSVGMNGVGLKAVNALSDKFEIRSYRDGKCLSLVFSKGVLQKEETKAIGTDETGTEVFFTPDGGKNLFENYKFDLKIVEEMVYNYAWLNRGLTMVFNGRTIKSKNGLSDLLDKKIGGAETVYDIIHYTSKTGNIEFAFTHVVGNYSEEYYSYANGQYTVHGGTHQSFFKEAVFKSFNSFFKKEWQQSDVREGLIGAIAIKINEPRFDSQVKTKLTNTENRQEIIDFVQESVTDYLLKNRDVADTILARITAAEKLHKQIQDVKKNSKEVQNRTRFNIPKLKDCIYHLTDRSKANQDKAKDNMIFICEGDSAAASFVKTRNPQLQAVFPVRGKVVNVEKKVNKNVLLYDSKNAELYNLVAALGIENDLDNLRYEKVVIATDADVDGYHIRLLLITFFINYFPELVISGRLFILETPLFKVRNKASLAYCYTESERDEAIERIKGAEITRFKGLGEVDAPDFKKFIGEEMKLIPVTISSIAEIEKDVTFYMGDNTPERTRFIMENLV